MGGAACRSPTAAEAPRAVFGLRKIRRPGGPVPRAGRAEASGADPGALRPCRPRAVTGPETRADKPDLEIRDCGRGPAINPPSPAFGPFDLCDTTRHTPPLPPPP